MEEFRGETLANKDLHNLFIEFECWSYEAWVNLL